MKILTFDIEDWYHILDLPHVADPKDWKSFEPRIHAGVHRILDTLDEFDIHATFFCLGWIAENYPDIIRDIGNRGHDIGTHSYYHQLVYTMSQKEFTADLVKSITTIENITGKKVLSYRAPGFSITPEQNWIYPILADNGIKISSSIFPARRSHGGSSDFIVNNPVLVTGNYSNGIAEFPISTTKFLNRNVVVTGGGYFRLAPSRLINHVIKSSHYTMTYFHPRDFDPNQPRLENLSLLRKFKLYYGLENSLSKLKRILDKENWQSINLELLKNLNLDSINHHNLSKTDYR